MKMIRIPLAYFYLLCVISCGEDKTNVSAKEPGSNNTLDVRNYTGNAFIFSDPEISRSRCYIIPVIEQDSIDFKKLNVEEGIRGKISIQMFFGHSDLLKLIHDKNKERITYKACNLPSDSIFYSRVFISYKNCVEMKDSGTTDSCNSVLIERTDSTEFLFRFLQSGN
jgi:hypothetical protein